MTHSLLPYSYLSHMLPYVSRQSLLIYYAQDNEEPHFVFHDYSLTCLHLSNHLPASYFYHMHAPCVYLAFMWGDFSYIVSEFIDRQMCDNSNTVIVTTAVQALITIPSPNLRPDQAPLLHQPDVLHPVQVHQGARGPCEQVSLALFLLHLGC